MIVFVRALGSIAIVATLVIATPRWFAQIAGQQPSNVPSVEGEGAAWFCPMHPDVTSAQPGRCRKCEMALIFGNPFDTRDYSLDLATAPRAVRVGSPVRMTFTVRNPRNGERVTAFEEVHDKRYHLFVISQDMSDFQHLHPEMRPDGSWELDVALGKPGYYRVISDFVPTGGSPQFIAHTLVTAEYVGTLLSQSARLEEDVAVAKTIDGIRAVVSVEPAILVAGEYGHLQFTLTDEKTGQPIRDLQPYLGAFGHTLIMSEDMRDGVHSHPSPGPQSDITRGFGGPEVTFEGYLPRPGLYRAWTQFLRQGELTTFSFTFRVRTLEDAVRLQELR